MKLSRLLQTHKVSVIVSILLGISVIGGGAAYAAATQSIVQGTTDHSVYAAGNSVDITGTINGDVYCGGQSVIIDAQVNGDVICAGQTVTLNGTVTGDVRIAGQTVVIGAKVRNNASILGETVTLQNNASIGRDASIGAQTLQLDGMIGRDLAAAANTITVNNSIGRDISARVGDHFILTDSAKVGGNVDYTSPHLWSKSSRATVSGTTTYHTVPMESNRSVNWVGLHLAWTIYCYLAMTVVALLLVAVFPQSMRRLQVRTMKNLGYVFLTGVIAMVALPALAIASFITVIGAPLGILIILFTGLVSILSLPVAFYLLGSRVVPQLHSLTMVLLGALILGFVALLPILGMIIGFLAYLFGLGAILWYLIHAYSNNRKATS